MQNVCTESRVTSKNSFITPNLGFFAPRDLVAGHGDGNFCLWNGFMGSAPGHPFLVSATERILNLVLNRGDYYDMEREACHYSSNAGDTDIVTDGGIHVVAMVAPIYALAVVVVFAAVVFAKRGSTDIAISWLLLRQLFGWYHQRICQRRHAAIESFLILGVAGVRSQR